MGKLRLLAGAIVLVGAAFAHAAPVAVHYTLYNPVGAVKSSAASGQATGDVGVGSTWINNQTLIAPEHQVTYLAKFWIDVPADMLSVAWTFNWSLAYGGSVTGQGTGNINSAAAGASVSIGTEAAGWRAVGGTSIATDTIGSSMLAGTSLSQGTTLSFGSASDPDNGKVGSVLWNGGTTSTVWAYVWGTASLSASTSVSAVFQNYGNVTARADVTIAQPLTPDNLLFGDGGGGGAVPEPGSLALLCGAGLMGLARRRRDRLKP